MGCKRGKTLPSTTEFRWSLKIRSGQGHEFQTICAGSDIIYCNPYKSFSDSVWPSWDVISSQSHRFDLAITLCQ